MIPQIPQNIQLYILVFSLAAIVFYAGARLARELQMMQLNSYRIERYRRWLKLQREQHKDDPFGKGTTDYWLDLIMVLTLGNMARGWIAPYVFGAIGLLCVYRGALIFSRRRRAKKPLVWTARVWRIFGVGMVIIVVSTALMALFLPFAWVQFSAVTGVLFAIAAPFVTIAAVWILGPVERAINRRYIADARRIMAEMPGLVVIGITGSYGKTSTKHYLYRILSERFSVLMTPGSFNTTLGVVRTIREQLRPFHQIFIVEMGAKQPGDIAEICDIVHPSIGIVTAVGEQHLESFGSIENVQRTKFELIDAVALASAAASSDGVGTLSNPRSSNLKSLVEGGVAILNDDFPMIANRPVSNVGRVFRYSAQGIMNNAAQNLAAPRPPLGGSQEIAMQSQKEPVTRDLPDNRVSEETLAPPKGGEAAQNNSLSTLNFQLSTINYSPTGTTFRILTPKGVETEPFTTRLVGIHNLSNVLAGYIAGRTLGMTDSEIRYAVGQIEQVEHRLSINRLPGPVTIIDDAFNSNPHGAAMALDVLKNYELRITNYESQSNIQPFRIVVTPGGNAHGDSAETVDSSRAGSQPEPFRIVVTPGMIELGEKQFEYNREFGLRMASACDFAIVVGEYNRAAIVAGLTEGGFPAEKIYTAATFPDAVQKVRSLTRPGAIILYENDLPDTFK